MTNYLKCFIFIFFAAAMAACGGDDEPENPNINPDIFTNNDIIGLWHCDDDYFQINRLRFGENGIAVFEYGNATSDIQQKYFNYSLEENGCKVYFTNADFTDLPYATLGRDAQNNLILYAIGDTYHKVSNNPGNINGAAEGTLTEQQLKQLVNKAVSITPRYSDYFWKITIKSKLHTELKNKKNTFGFGCGELYDYTENIMYESNLSSNRFCSYRKQMAGDTEIIEIEVPFWYYFIFGKGSDDEIFANCEMFYTSYTALNAQDASNWSVDEKNLYKDLVKYLNEYESTAKWDFQPSIYVHVDGCSVMIARFKR